MLPMIIGQIHEAAEHRSVQLLITFCAVVKSICAVGKGNFCSLIIM